MAVIVYKVEVDASVGLPLIWLFDTLNVTPAGKLRSILNVVDPLPPLAVTGVNAVKLLFLISVFDAIT